MLLPTCALCQPRCIRQSGCVDSKYAPGTPILKCSAMLTHYYCCVFQSCSSSLASHPHIEAAGPNLPRATTHAPHHFCTKVATCRSPFLGTWLAYSTQHLSHQNQNSFDFSIGPEHVLTFGKHRPSQGCLDNYLSLDLLATPTLEIQSTINLHKLQCCFCDEDANSCLDFNWPLNIVPESRSKALYSVSDDHHQQPINNRHLPQT